MNDDDHGGGGDDDDDDDDDKYDLIPKVVGFWSFEWNASQSISVTATRSCGLVTVLGAADGGILRIRPTGVWIVAFGGPNFPVPAIRPSTSLVSSYLARGDRL